MWSIHTLIIRLEHAIQLLERILAAVQPLPAVGFGFTITLEGQILQGARKVNIKNSQKFTASIQPVDAKGNPAAVDGIPKWSVSDATILTLIAAANGMSADIAAVGPLGNAKVAVSADADLGAGVRTIFGTLDVTVIQGDAVGFKIVTTEPVEQTAPLTP